MTDPGTEQHDDRNGADAYSDPNEPFDVFTSDGRPTGRTKRRADVHRDGDWHRSFHCWVTCLAPRAAGRSAGPSTAPSVPPGGRSADEPSWLILQRRGLQKDTWPARLDASVGGHYRAGETLADVVREVEEEIGQPAPLAHLRRLGRRVSVSEPAGGARDRELQDVYLWTTALPFEAFRPRPLEVVALEAVRLPDLLDLLSGSATRASVFALSPDGATVNGEITPDDFIPTVDNYFYRVAVAVDLARRGYGHPVV